MVMRSAASADSASPLETSDGKPCGPARSSHQRELFMPLGSDTPDCDSTPTSASPVTSRRSTSSRAASRVRTSASPVIATDWPAPAQAFSLSSFEFWRSLGLSGSYLRTSMGCYRALKEQEVETSVSSWPRWLSAGIASPGGFSTVDISDSPNDAVESSLLDIQLTGELPPRFFLSQRAARGILRRARRRGVTIGEPVLSALLRLAAEGSTRTTAARALSFLRSCHAAPRASGRRLTVNASPTRSTRAVGEGTTLAAVVRWVLSTSSSRRSSRVHTPTLLDAAPHSLRRLTPLEWERLQGFPDHWTCVRSARAGQTAHVTEVLGTQSVNQLRDGSRSASTE